MTGAIALMAIAALEAELVHRVRDRQRVNAAVPARIATTGFVAVLFFVLAKAGS